MSSMEENREQSEKDQSLCNYLFDHHCWPDLNSELGQYFSEKKHQSKVYKNCVNQLKVYSFYEAHGCLPRQNSDVEEEVKVARFWHRKSNRLCPFDTFIDLCLKEASLKEKEKRADEIVQALEGFCGEWKTFPSQSGKRPGERELILRYNNAGGNSCKPCIFNEEQLGTVAFLKEKFGKRHIDPHEAVEIIESYCNREHRMPKEGCGDEAAEAAMRSLAHVEYRKKVLTKEELSRYERCQKKYGRKKLTPTEAFKDFYDFVEMRRRLPRRQAEGDDKMEERRLACAIAKGRLDGWFSDEQLQYIDEAARKYSSGGHVSFSEKLVSVALNELLKELVTSFEENKKVNGREADVFFCAGNNMFVVQYDGSVHASEESAESDSSANQAHFEAGVSKVVRLREPGISNLSCDENDKERLLIFELDASFSSLAKSHREKILIEICTGFGFDSNDLETARKSLDWEQIHAEAETRSQSSYVWAKLIGEYATHILIHGEGPRRGPNYDPIIHRLERHKNHISNNGLEMLAYLEKTYDKPGRTRFWDWYEKRKADNGL